MAIRDARRKLCIRDCSVPEDRVRGDPDPAQAIVTSYLQILCLDHQGEPRELPNHGVSQGYRIHRVVANRWQLVKTKGDWMIKTRTMIEK